MRSQGNLATVRVKIHFAGGVEDLGSASLHRKTPLEHSQGWEYPQNPHKLLGTPYGSPHTVVIEPP
jgi:hypothetical protein